ncbi:hypothetical protein KC336_g32 [Hortaea werneckii]|nr:hypothetical protein KC336_g32 [Hortaea werneckii]
MMKLENQRTNRCLEDVRDARSSLTKRGTQFEYGVVGTASELDKKRDYICRVDGVALAPPSAEASPASLSSHPVSDLQTASSSL